MKKTLLFLFICILYLQTAFSQGNFLLPRFQDEVVSMQFQHSGKYLHHTPSTTNLRIGQLGAPGNNVWDDKYQWEIVSTDEANWYRIRHVGSNRYVTVMLQTDGEFVEMQPLNYNNNPDAQKFKFVLQNCAGCTDVYKIHTKYMSQNNPGEALVLQLGLQDLADGKQVYTWHNFVTSDDRGQQFKLTLLYPDDDPTATVGNLADRFENRTSGITAVFNGWELLGSTNHNRLYEQSPTPGITADEEWKIEYSDQTGWFRIRNKLQNKYITVTGVDGETVLLQNSFGSGDPRQKFKFVQMAGYTDRYKIHSRYSIGSPKRALVLDVPTAATIDIRLIKNKQTNGYNQVFQLMQDLPPAARFSDGVITDGAGKLLTKQYHISSRESLAMLEPYVVGTDTFVRVQQNPVYGKQSEWTMLKGSTQGGQKSFRLLYAKTMQLLYLPVATSNTSPAADFKLKLKSVYTTDTLDKRNEFEFDQIGSIDHWFKIESRVGSNSTPNRLISINDDGDLVTYPSNSAGTYEQPKHFCINLTLPSDSNNVFIIATKNQGHLLSDNGIIASSANSPAPVVHNQYADESCQWRLLPTSDGYYQIRNKLTRQLLTSNTTSDNALVYASPPSSGTTTKWTLETEGNFYKLKNLFSGKYLAVYNQFLDGDSVRQGGPAASGTLWNISLSDYLQQPELTGLTSATLLSNYNPNSINPFNDSATRNNMMANIGVMFEPLYHRYHGGFNDLVNAGVPTTNPPSFYAILRTALNFKYGYTQAQIDSAVKNYKLTFPGHRMQMAYALRSFILENLALRSRNTWSYDEVKLVEMMELRIKKLHEGYAERLEKAWHDFFADQLNGQDGLVMLFSASGIASYIDYSAFTPPDYFTPDANESLNMVEYARVNKGNNYRNPGRLGTVEISYVTTSGGTLISSCKFNETFLNSNSSTGFIIRETVQHITNAIQLAVQLTQGIYEAAFSIGATLAAISTAGAVTATVGTVLVMVQGIVMAVMEGMEYENFVGKIDAKVARFRNDAINTEGIMQGRNMLHQIQLLTDYDILFSSGKRFDNQYNDAPVFVGSGNWSDPANWGNARVPSNPLPPFTEVTIDPIDSCIMDIPVDATAPPIVIFRVKPGKTLRIKSGVQFKIEDLYITKP